MQTRCPNPRCKHLFEVGDDREGKNGPCPACGQVITFRSLAILNEIDRQNEQRARLKQLPPADPNRVFPFSALLEDVRSLWNVGSIFRSADGAGFEGLYLCGITGCPPRKEIAKTSLGAEDHIAWEYQPGALHVLPRLKEKGVQIVALEKTETSETLTAALARGALRVPMCLVVGNEVAGVTAEALSVADATVHLPMRGMKGSLNVAVAFGIAAYQIRESVTA